MRSRREFSIIVLLGVLLSFAAGAVPARADSYGAYVGGWLASGVGDSRSAIYYSQTIDGTNLTAVTGKMTLSPYSESYYSTNGTSMTPAVGFVIDYQGASLMASAGVGNKLAMITTATGPNTAVNAGTFVYDTLSFSGQTHGAFGTLNVSGNYSHNLPDEWWIPGVASGGLYTYLTANSSMGEVSRASMNAGGAGAFPNPASFVMSVLFPLDAGPIRFSHHLDQWVNSYSNGSYTINFDPSWTFTLPAGVSLSSASGVQYPVPEAFTLAFLSLGLFGTAVARRGPQSKGKRDVLQQFNSRRNSRAWCD